jgi:hypothetical protein
MAFCNEFGLLLRVPPGPCRVSAQACGCHCCPGCDRGQQRDTALRGCGVGGTAQGHEAEVRAAVGKSYVLITRGCGVGGSAQGHEAEVRAAVGKSYVLIIKHLPVWHDLQACVWVLVQ